MMEIYAEIRCRRLPVAEITKFPRPGDENKDAVLRASTMILSVVVLSVEQCDTIVWIFGL